MPVLSAYTITKSHIIKFRFMQFFQGCSDLLSAQSSSSTALYSGPIAICSSLNKKEKCLCVHKTRKIMNLYTLIFVFLHCNRKDKKIRDRMVVRCSTNLIRSYPLHLRSVNLLMPFQIILTCHILKNLLLWHCNLSKGMNRHLVFSEFNSNQPQCWGLGRGHPVLLKYNIKMVQNMYSV
jgi:hypothetical protein